MIENRVLNYFLVIAREQNMTKAAALLHISQSTLSKQMSDLEEQLKIKLFKRTNKNTLLTEDGMLFRTRAHEMIELMNKLESEFSNTDSSISGDVYIGCGETYIMQHICKILRHIQINYPNIRFNIFSGEAMTIQERIDKGLIDIGLLLGPIKDEKFYYEQLRLSDTFGLLVPNDCEYANRTCLKIDEIINLPMIIPSQSHDLEIIPKFTRVVGTYNLITNATYMIEEGLGYVFCLDKLVNTEGRNFSFVKLDSDQSINAYITTKKYTYASKASRLVYNEILKALKMDK